MIGTRDSAALPTWERGDWMQLFSGRRFFPMDPKAEDIEDVDIAHALGLLCRYGGHVNRFYSVAEHCVLMSDFLVRDGRDLALKALLHDATEAYVVDVPRPIKQYLDGYSEIESEVWGAIAAKFGVDTTIPAEVHEADNRILLTERDALMQKIDFPWSVEDLVPLPVEIKAWSPAVAEHEYLIRLRWLTGEYSE